MRWEVNLERQERMNGPGRGSGTYSPGGEKHLGILRNRKRQCEWKTKAGGRVGCNEVEEVGMDQTT